MPAPNEISVKQLNRLIGTPNCPVIIDVCIDPDFKEDPYIIPGSIRHSHSDAAGLAAKMTGQKVVVVCQKGLKLSQGMAAFLRASGVEAEYLKGGMYAWRDDADTCRIPAVALTEVHVDQGLWVTRHRPKIDRIACPWLIRRFVDRNAKFLFVAPSEVVSVAERFGAIPFDVKGVSLTHKGDGCTFDTMLDTFKLHNTALDRLATVVRAADTNRHDLVPEAAGLLAVSVGLSRQIRDDNRQLDAGLAIYDALYRWARDGFEEEHDALGEKL